MVDLKLINKKKKRVSQYSKPEFREDVIKLRNEGKDWNSIRDELGEKYEWKPSRKVLRDVYEEQIAKGITISKKAGKTFQKYEDELHNMFGRIINALESYLQLVEKVTNSFQSVDPDDLKSQIMFMRTSGDTKNIIQQIFDAIKIMQEQQDRILIEKKKLAFSTNEINEQIMKQLHILQKEGFIAILKNLPEDF